MFLINYYSFSINRISPRTDRIFAVQMFNLSILSILSSSTCLNKMVRKSSERRKIKVDKGKCLINGMELS